MRWSHFVVSCAMTLVVQAGCRSTPSRQQSKDVPPPLVLLEQYVADDAATASEVLELSAGTSIFQIVSGDHAGETLVRAIEATDQHGAAWKIAESIDARPPHRISFVNRDDDGNVVMTAVEEAHDKALTFFNPPLVIAFASQRAGEPQTSASAMRVVSMTNHSQVREKGTATRTMIYSCSQRIRIASGEFDAKRIDIEFAADLKLADAEERATIFIVPGFGVAAEESDETVKVLGAFGRTTRRTLVRADLSERNDAD